ncbi:hypothetical protein M408DRAFT_327089 [Serendipita vermifera MAFF 305830]|uniref:Myb-like domain-containing protein n=1 Tax=Serendipita vermifera MAFF 305830 TaxID=933852 RepID=A0A0C3B467_SERVB|nr:hypothetical protein M408DRAFT_327089 [Serendipita vermifera MAFF 305830]
MASSKLFRKLKSVAAASKSFSLACERALKDTQPDIDASFSQSQSQSQDPFQAAQREELELTEQELRAWRDATEPLQKLLPENTVYFVPYSVIPPSEADGSLLARINAINLALVLEMFLPFSTRQKYPGLTLKIPYIDNPDTVPSSQSLSHLSMSTQSSFGLSQASQPLTKEQQIEKLIGPLDELKMVYLRLCVGRKEKHVLYVLKRILLEICCIAITTSTRARDLGTFRPQDLVDTFSSAFLRDPSLVGVGKIFETKQVQEKACRLWEKWAGDMVLRLNSNLTGSSNVTWEGIGDTLLTDVFRHVLHPILQTLEEAESKVKSKASDSTEPIAAPDKVVSKKAKIANEATTSSIAPTKPSAKVVPSKAIGNDHSLLPAASKPTEKATSSTLQTAQPPSTTARKAAPTSVEPRPVPKSKATKPLATLNLAPSSSIEEDEFGPRIPNPAHKGKVVLPETEGVTPRPVGEEFDMMDYMHGFDADDGQDFANAGGFDDAGAIADAGLDAPEETQFEDLVARFGQAPYVEAPKQGYTRIPKDFRFNAPQRNAVKVTMTPSPESQAKQPSAAPSGTTLSRMKSAIVSEQAKSKTITRATSTGPAGEAATIKAKGRKRKPVEEEDGAHADDAAVPRTKKRKVATEMLPPARSTKATESSSTRSSATAAGPPHAAVHSSASGILPTHSSTMAGPSRAAETRPAAPKVARRNQVLADTDSSDDEPVIRKKAAAPALGRPKSIFLAERPAEPAKPLPKKTVQPVPLVVSDAIMSASKTRLEQIKAINKESKRLAAELGPDEDSDAPPKDENENDEKTEDSDSEEELRKHRQATGRGNGVKALDESRKKLEDLKRRAKATSTLPMRTRLKHIVPEPLSDDEPEAVETGEEEEPKPRKRGRPRGRVEKAKDSDAPSRSRSPAAKKARQRPNLYKTNAAEVGRKRWTDEENKVFLFALEGKYHDKKASLVNIWSDILELHGPNGTECQTLANRNGVQLKDRARNIAMKMVKEGKELPEYLSFFKLPAVRVRK